MRGGILDALVAAYRRDPSTPYGMSIPPREVLADVGEYEPIVDADADAIQQAAQHMGGGA